MIASLSRRATANTCAVPAACSMKSMKRAEWSSMSPISCASASVDVTTYHDDVSTSQNENLNRIVDFHNSKTRDLDVSVHFNAYVETSKPMGIECLYITQPELAGQVSAAISWCGLLNRGPKKRTDLYFPEQHRDACDPDRDLLCRFSRGCSGLSAAVRS